MTDDIKNLIAAGNSLFGELAYHGLSPHNEDECVAGAAMDWWRRALAAFRSDRPVTDDIATDIATIREALTWIPDGYDQVELGEERPLRLATTGALDRVEARNRELTEALEQCPCLHDIASVECGKAGIPADQWCARCALLGETCQ